MQTAPAPQTTRRRRGRLRLAIALTALLLMTTSALAGCASAAAEGSSYREKEAANGNGKPVTEYGPPLRLGDGKIQMYSQRRGSRPVSVGYVFSHKTLQNLPQQGDGKLCHDVNGDGRVDRERECVNEHALELDLPQNFRKKVGGPLQWALLTWDPQGHPPEIYSVPHFDFHFYLEDRKAVHNIRTGPCEGIMNCEDLRTARVPVPERYLPPRYHDMGAVVPGMGNHLMDMDAPEFSGRPFTQNFMYGAYDGKVTFLEPMVDKAWIEGLSAGREGSCSPIRQPSAWQKSGWYPTKYCLDYRSDRQQYTVSLEGFVHRRAS